MPFQYVLVNLLADQPDAIGALFLDDSGETIDFACADSNPFEMRLLGAYLGIYLRQLGRAMTATNLGEVRWLHIERQRYHLHGLQLPDGYYLVLVQAQPGRVGSAREGLRRAAEDLEREIF